MPTIDFFFGKEMSVGDRVKLIHSIDLPVYDGRVVKGRVKVTGTIVEDLGESGRYVGTMVHHDRVTGVRDDVSINMGEGYYRVELD